MRCTTLLSALFAISLPSTAACGDDDDDDTGPPADAGGDPDAQADGGSDAGSDDPLVVDTAEGAVRGASADGARAFLGIPYAAPPTGEARWRPPAAVTPWQEPRDATVRGAPCPQNALIGDSWVDESREDCLTLNVWTPDPAPEAPRPVLVWFHGGGFTSGSGGDEIYDGARMARERDVVVVTVNYRLGPLGFLYHPALADEQEGAEGPGNYGLLDQRAAMQWVRRNVAAFGGDAANVTIFGESAGGMSVCLHMVSPGSGGLFDAAIIESGPCDQPFPDVVGASATAAELQTAVGCDGAPDVLGCLRAVEPETLVNALQSEDAPTTLVDAFIWFPVIDGAVIVEPPARSFEFDTFVHVPVVAGTNRDEGSLLVQLSYSGVTPEELETFVRDNAGDGADAVLAAYPLDSFESTEAALAAILTDAVFACPTRRLLRSIVANGGDAFVYEFAEPLDVPLLPDMGAFHGAELPFVWGNSLLGQELSAEQRSLSTEMQGYWTRFAESADPNGEGATAWPPYVLDEEEHLVFLLPLPLATGDHLREATCDVLDAAIRANR